MIPRWRFLVAAALLVGAWCGLNLHRVHAVHLNRPLSEIPNVLGEWRAVSEIALGQGDLEAIAAADHVYRTYEDAAGDQVTAYLAFHDGSAQSGPHSPKHCLVGSGWSRLKEEEMRLPVGATELPLVRATYQKGLERGLFLYWYQVRGKSLSSEYDLKLAELAGSLWHGRRDSAFVRIFVPYETDAGEDGAFSTGSRFVAAFWPVIEGFLPP
jgi:EpsI family protein